MSTTEFVIVPRGPFSLARASDVVAHWPPLRHQPKTEDGTIRLGFVADRTFAPVAVSIRTVDYLGVLRVAVFGDIELTAARRQVARIFTLDVDATAYPEVARREPALASLMKEHEGLRPVSFTSPYECACWAVLSQRTTTDEAARVLRAIVDEHGPKVDVNGAAVGVFPPPEVLLRLSAIAGLPRAKVERLHAIARAALEGALDAAMLRALPEAEALARLRELPGIGDFWSAGIWLRACGAHDRFPDEAVSQDALRALAPDADPERFRPFGMWIAFLLRVASRRGREPQDDSHAAPTRRRAPAAA